jgi:hypothetical protein
MGNKQSTKMSNILVQTNEDCYICMESVNSIDMVSICKNKHKCCESCVKRMYDNSDSDSDIDSEAESEV